MRLHRLEMEAFGPFAQTATVDFDALAAEGLFLVHGPTGSGKTSVLDAICFALFADVPGARSKKSLHSDHAAREVVPRVELEWTSGERRLRIRRSPEFSRPKKRGTGLVNVPAQVTLEEFRSGRWEALSARHDEAAEVVDDVLGLGKEQFAKVAMLPQGDFAAFLRATPEERRALLERLFDITTFADIEAWLSTACRETGAVVAQHQMAVESGLARVVEIVGQSGLVAEAEAGQAPRPEPSGEQPTSDGDMEHVEQCQPEPSQPESAWTLTAADPHLLDRLEECVSALALRESTTLATLDRAESEERLAATAAEDGRRLRDRQQRAAAATAERVRLLAQQAQITTDRRHLDAAERARSVAGHLQAMAREERDLQAALGDLEQRRQDAAPLLPTSEHDSDENLKGLGTDLEDAALLTAETLRTAETLLESVTVFDEPLTTAQRLLDELDELDSRTSARERELVQVTGRLAKLDEQIEQVQGELTSLGAPDERLEEARRAAEAARAEVSRAAEMADLAEQLEAQELAIARLREDLLSARESAQAVRQSYLDVQQRRIDGMAAELAGRLTDGCPCPVCGSATHPAPAVAATAVTAEDVAAAGALAERADADYRRCESKHAAELAAAEAMRQQLPDGVDLGALRELLAAASSRQERADEELAAATSASELAALLTTGLEQAGVARTAVATGQTGLEVVLAELSEHRERIDTQLAEIIAAHANDCPCQGSHVDDADQEQEGNESSTSSALPPHQHRELVAGHRRATATAQRLLDAEHAARAARGRLADAATVASSAARDAGFADTTAVSAAALDPREIEQLRERVTAHERALATCEATLAEPEIAAALDLPEPDLEELAAAAAQRRSDLLAATAERSRIRSATVALTRHRDDIAEHWAVLVPTRTRHAQLKMLAETVTGQGANNTMRMRLTSFVLAARLEKVVALANERLVTLGQGRYLLEHSDELVSRGARSGLGLRVLDQWTGRTRDTATLSGGEAFMASLSLALGLADAVREETGGRTLGTLFVDEGFGTLDDDALEEVLGVLDSLREGGRAVGVVSHVAELRNRISSQLIVAKTSTGSSLRQRIPSGDALSA
jgi:exonuclease SbcC